MSQIVCRDEGRETIFEQLLPGYKHFDFVPYMAHTHTMATVQSHHPSGRMLSYLNYETCVYEDCIHKIPILQTFYKEYAAQEHE